MCTVMTMGWVLAKDRRDPVHVRREVHVRLLPPTRARGSVPRQLLHLLLSRHYFFAQPRPGALLDDVGRE